MSTNLGSFQTPLYTITDSVKKLKEYSLQRQITTVAAKIKEGDFNQICKLQDLKEKFENLNSVRNLKKIDDKFEKFISDFDLDLKKLKNKKIEYLYDQFILKNDIIMFVARPGVGKSLMALALCNMLLDAKTVKRVFYLDGDNSHITIKSRNIDLVKDKFGNRLNYFIELSDLDLYRIITELKKKDLSDFLIIFDSIKNFIIGDRNSHKDVTDMMNILKELRKNGATIIFLHHQNKLNKDFNSAFAGSSAFMEDIALAFKYYKDNTLIKINLDYALETNEDAEIKELILSFIKNHKDKPIYSDILKHLVDCGYNKDRVNKIIQNGKNVCWKVTSLTQNNKTIYTLIDREDNQDKSIQGIIK